MQPSYHNKGEGMGTQLRRFLIIIICCFFGVIFFAPSSVHARCWSSTGCDGTTWLEVSVTAGGAVASDVQVYLQPESYLSGYYSLWESACTNTSGVARFKTASDDSDCNSSYWYGGELRTYCNWSCAYCSNVCFEDDENGWYSNQSIMLEDYKVVASPTYDSTLGELYAAAEATDIDINFSGSQSKNIALIEKDKILRVRVKDDEGNPITNGVHVSVSGPTYSYKSVQSSFTDIYTISGNHYVSAWCNNWPCDYACFTYLSSVAVGDDDTLVQVEITAKRNNSTLELSVLGDDTGSPISGAYVSVGNYDYESGANACYAYGWGQTDSNGLVTIRLPENNYTANVSPPSNYNSGTGNYEKSPYAGAEKAVTLVSNQTTSDSIRLRKKDAAITVSAVDSSGNPVSGAWVSIWTYSDDVHDWNWGQTGSDGIIALDALNDQRYNIYVSYWDSASYGNNQSISHCNREGMQAVRAPATATATFDVWDSSVTFHLEDESGNGVSGVYGGGSIRLASASAENWCGAWINFDGASVTKNLAADTDYKIEPWVWGSTNYDPFQTSIAFTTAGSGGSATVPVTLISVDSEVSGDYVTVDGEPADLDSNYIYVYATRGGSLWRSATASRTSYEVGVSRGRWCVGYWLDWNSGYASLAPGSSTSCLDVVAASTNDLDLVFLEVANLKVCAKDQNGEALRWAWCEASPYSATDVASEDRRRYWNNGCSTGSDCDCEIKVGGGIDYYVNCYRPWSEMSDDSLTLPEEVQCTAVAGQTTECPESTFRRTDGQMNITIVAAEEATTSINSKGAKVVMPNPILNAQASLPEEVVNGAWISASDESGGYFETTADSLGTATLPCSAGNIIHAVGVNLIGTSLYISEDAEATCVPTETSGPIDLNIKMNFATTVPESQTITQDAGSVASLTLSDGFSFTAAASCFGESGNNVTVAIQPDPFLPYQAGRRPASFYGYDITITDQEGNEVTQFNCEATLCFPLDAEQLERLDLSAADARVVYRDTSTDSYRDLTQVTIDAENNLACGRTNHSTEFVVIGSGNLQAIDGDTEDAEEEAERTGEDASGQASGASGCGCRIDGNGNRVNSVWWMALLAVSWIMARRLMKRKRVLTVRNVSGRRAP